MQKEIQSNNKKPFREKLFMAEFNELIDANRHEKALSYLIDHMPRLLASGLNRKEKLNHLLFTSRLVQNGGNTKHGSSKLLKKAKSVVRAMDQHNLKSRKLFVDFGAGAHDPIALSTYFYLNGFNQVLANDMLAPRNLTYSALSMRDILADMHAKPELFLLPGSDLDLYQKRLREFDTEAFGEGKFYDGFAGTDGRVSYVVDDIVKTGIKPNSVSIVVSFAVFEHVSDMDGVLDFLFESTAPGGLGFHFIDLADHRSYRKDGQFDPFSFLTEKEGPANINRLRKSEQQGAFTDAGFVILSSEGKTAKIPESTRKKFLPKWARMSEGDKSSIGVTLHVQKPTTGVGKSTKKQKKETAKKAQPKTVPAAKTKKIPTKKTATKTEAPKTPGLRMSELGWLKEYRTPLPETLKKHPSMMSLVEREVLYGLASNYYEGKGAIIDAGVFLGASTRIFGKGVSVNAQKSEIIGQFKKPIVTFEHGQLGKGMMGFFERHGVDTTDLIEGTSFVPLLRKMIKDVRPMIDLRVGDILKQKWDKTPIEILFLDVVKSAEINQFVFENFFPRLIPGKSIVIQQDYFIDRLPFLKISQELLDPYFEYIGNAQSSGYFLLKKKIPAKAIKDATNPMGRKLEKKLSLIENCADRIRFDRDRSYLVLISKIIQILDDQDYDTGVAALAELNEAFPEQSQLLTSSKNRLAMGLRLLDGNFRQSKKQLATSNNRIK